MEVLRSEKLEFYKGVPILPSDYMITAIPKEVSNVIPHSAPMDYLDCTFIGLAYFGNAIRRTRKVAKGSDTRSKPKKRPPPKTRKMAAVEKQLASLGFTDDDTFEGDEDIIEFLVEKFYEIAVNGVTMGNDKFIKGIIDFAHNSYVYRTLRVFGIESGMGEDEKSLLRKGKVESSALYYNHLTVTLGKNKGTRPSLITIVEDNTRSLEGRFKEAAHSLRMTVVPIESPHGELLTNKIHLGDPMTSVLKTLGFKLTFGGLLYYQHNEIRKGRMWLHVYFSRNRDGTEDPVPPLLDKTMEILSKIEDVDWITECGDNNDHMMLEKPNKKSASDVFTKLSLDATEGHEVMKEKGKAIIVKNLKKGYFLVIDIADCVGILPSVKGWMQTKFKFAD